jgi:hypothetical protein
MRFQCVVTSHKLLRRMLCSLMATSFLLTTVFPSISFAQTVLNLPQLGTMLLLSEPYIPVHLKGIQFHPEQPLRYDFILDTGQESYLHSDGALEDVANTQIKYFLAALTVPEDHLWVNLSPYEKDRIVEKDLGQTELGRDMLAQDYMLKQLAASLLYPENETGKKFWDKIYQKAYDELGTTNILLDTFNKIWVVPDTASVRVDGASVYIVDQHLKVMLEHDYLARESNTEVEEKDESYQITADLIREIILPAIENEINTGKTFANLRQMYSALILAKWYKKHIKESLLADIYVNQGKINGVDHQQEAIIDEIYNQYTESFKQGVYNYIKEEYDPVTHDILPRKYFSGGLSNKFGVDDAHLTDVKFDGQSIAVTTDLEILGENQNTFINRLRFTGNVFLNMALFSAATALSPLAISTSYAQKPGIIQKDVQFNKRINQLKDAMVENFEVSKLRDNVEKESKENEKPLKDNQVFERLGDGFYNWTVKDPGDFTAIWYKVAVESADKSDDNNFSVVMQYDVTGGPVVLNINDENGNSEINLDLSKVVDADKGQKRFFRKDKDGRQFLTITYNEIRQFFPEAIGKGYKPYKIRRFRLEAEGALKGKVSRAYIKFFENPKVEDALKEVKDSAILSKSQTLIVSSFALLTAGSIAYLALKPKESTEDIIRKAQEPLIVQWEEEGRLKAPDANQSESSDGDRPEVVEPVKVIDPIVQHRQIALDSYEFKKVKRKWKEDSGGDHDLERQDDNVYLWTFPTVTSKFSGWGYQQDDFESVSENNFVDFVSMQPYELISGNHTIILKDEDKDDGKNIELDAQKLVALNDRLPDDQKIFVEGVDSEQGHPLLVITYSQIKEHFPEAIESGYKPYRFYSTKYEADKEGEAYIGFSQVRMITKKDVAAAQGSVESKSSTISTPSTVNGVAKKDMTVAQRKAYILENQYVFQRVKRTWAHDESDQQSWDREDYDVYLWTFPTPEGNKYIGWGDVQETDGVERTAFIDFVLVQPLELVSGNHKIVIEDEKDQHEIKLDAKALVALNDRLPADKKILIDSTDPEQPHPLLVITYSEIKEYFPEAIDEDYNPYLFYQVKLEAIEEGEAYVGFPGVYMLDNGKALSKATNTEFKNSNIWRADGDDRQALKIVQEGGFEWQAKRHKGVEVEPFDASKYPGPQGKHQWHRDVQVQSRLGWGYKKIDNPGGITSSNFGQKAVFLPMEILKDEGRFEILFVDNQVNPETDRGNQLYIDVHDNAHPDKKIDAYEVAGGYLIPLEDLLKLHGGVLPDTFNWNGFTVEFETHTSSERSNRIRFAESLPQVRNRSEQLSDPQELLGKQEFTKAGASIKWLWTGKKGESPLEARIIKVNKPKELENDSLNDYSLEMKLRVVKGDFNLVIDDGKASVDPRSGHSLRVPSQWLSQMGYLKADQVSLPLGGLTNLRSLIFPFLDFDWSGDVQMRLEQVSPDGEVFLTAPGISKRNRKTSSVDQRSVSDPMVAFVDISPQTDSASIAKYGGIDFNPNSFEIEEFGNKDPAMLTFVNHLKTIESNQVDGLMPIILQIVPFTPSLIPN